MTSRPGPDLDEDDLEHDDFLREVAHVDEMAPPARPLLPGQTLGRFHILSELGRGGMGIVYLAHDDNLRRAVALKLLSPSLTRKDERTRRFLREARAAASVTHRNLATIYDAGDLEGHVFIAMERVEGRTLREILGGGRPALERALDIAAQILAGLGKAHQAGVVHRDLKPDNIMLTDDGVVKLLDFGLAKQHDVGALGALGIPGDPEGMQRDTEENQRLGTPGYMSPEQVRGGPIDARSDIFAFGVLFYEMLAGQRPFVGQSHADLASAILRDAPRRLSELRPELPPELERLVERCLEKDPALRFPSSGDLAIALARLDRVDAGPAAPPSGPTPSPDVISSMAGSSTSSLGATTPVRQVSERASVPAKVLAAVLVLVVAGLLLRVKSRAGSLETIGGPAASTEATRETAAAAALAARAVPTPVTALPLPTSKSPEALVAYKAALQGFRDGNWGYVQAHLERALALDPGLTIAHLRLAIMQRESSVTSARAHFALALAGRASLSERDQVMLNAHEPYLYRDPPDRAEQVRRLRAATERFPGDAELFDMLACTKQDPEQMLAAARRAVELDPQYADSWQAVGSNLFQLGRTEEALAALDRCIALSPATADCSGERGYIHAREGRCAEMDEDFRRAVGVTTSGKWQDGRANSLFALGMPPEAILEVYQNKWAQLGAQERLAAEPIDRSHLGLVTGDFHAAERYTLAAREAVASDPEAATQAQLALQLVEIYTETNRPTEAARVAENYLKRKTVWIRSSTSDLASISMYWAMYRAKLLSREAFVERRDAWLRDQRPDVSTSDIVSSYALGVETTAEAREALALLPNEALPVLHDWHEPAFGKLYALADRTKEALPLLQRTVKSCYALMIPLAHTRAFYHLGRALEASGDREGACSAYANVLERWGNAKPPSVTASKARERSRELRCSASGAPRTG